MAGTTGGRTRRQVLRAAGAGAAAWTVGRALGTPTWSIIRSRAALAQSGPDVYVVTLDDCSPEYIGYYQSILPTAYQGPIHTPELDALLGDSWTSSSCRATVPVCAASRSSFLSAVPAVDSGVFGDIPLISGSIVAAWVDRVAAGELISLPGFLTSLGFDTAARGKVDHTGGLMSVPGQIGEEGTHTRIADLFNDPAYAPDGRSGSDFSYMPYAALPAGVIHVDELRVDEQIARINAPYNGQRVDFLGFAMPHAPRTVHQSWIDLYGLADIQLRTTPAEVEADQADIPATHVGLLEAPYLLGDPRYDFMVANLTTDGLKEHIRHMLATLSHTSFQIGRLKAALDAAGRPYVMVLTSDHGYHLAEKGHYSKATLYDKALLAPMAVYSSDPNSSYPVGNSDKPLSLLGLAKTVAGLAGVTPESMPAQWQGTAFDDPVNDCTEHTWGADAASESRALVFKAVSTNTTYKIIAHPGDDGELYNLTVDPGEIDNLFVANGAAAQAQRAEVDHELRQRARRQRAAQWLREGRRPTDPPYM